MTFNPMWLLSLIPIAIGIVLIVLYNKKFYVNKNRGVLNSIKVENYDAADASASASASNPAPSLPNLPSGTEIMGALYTSSTSLLTLFLIRVFVYLFKSNQLPYSTTNSAQTIQTIQNYINSQIINSQWVNNQPPSIKVIQVLTYTCPGLFSQSYAYGGMIVEYSAPLDFLVPNSKYVTIPLIVYRGTQTNCEWGQDFTTALVTPTWIPNSTSIGVQVHKGFNNMYTTVNKTTGTSVQSQIWSYINSKLKSPVPPPVFIVTGHSLGGGLTYLTSADVAAKGLRNKFKFFPIAGPYSGNQDFVNYIVQSSPVVSNVPSYTGLFATINNSDPVPNTQFNDNYARVPSQLFCFTTPPSYTGSSVHIPETYAAFVNLNQALFDNNAMNASCGNCAAKTDSAKVVLWESIKGRRYGKPMPNQPMPIQPMPRPPMPNQPMPNQPMPMPPMPPMPQPMPMPPMPMPGQPIPGQPIFM